jgi:hypothetical protein
MMAKEVKAGVRITGKDDTGSAFSSLSKSLSKAENKFQKFGRQTAGIRAGFADVARGFAVAGGVIVGAAVGIGAGILKLAKDTADYGSALNDFSMQTGIGVESLQQFDYVAQQTGVGIEAGRAGITKFSKALGEIKMGTGQAALALRKLDPALLKNLKSVGSVGEGYELLIDRLARTTDPIKRSQLAFAVFGRSGGAMLKMINQGPEAIAALRAEMVKLGIISEKDAAAADEYGDALDKFGTALGGVKRAVGTSLIPALLPVFKTFTEFLSTNREAIGTAAGILAKGFGAGVLDFIEKLKANPTLIQDWVKRNVGALQEIAGQMARMGQAARDIIDLFDGGTSRHDRAVTRTGSGIVHGLPPTSKIEASGSEYAWGGGGMGGGLGLGRVERPVLLDVTVHRPKDVDMTVATTPGGEKVSIHEAINYFDEVSM